MLWHRERASDDKDGANDFYIEFGEFVEAECFATQEVLIMTKQARFGRKRQIRPILHKRRFFAGAQDK